MVLDWFRTADVAQYAGSVCKEYLRLRKSSAIRMDDAQKRAKKIERLVLEIKEFKRSKKLNFYKTTIMINVIREGLRGQGIPEPEVTAFVDSVLLADMPLRAR